MTVQKIGRRKSKNYNVDYGKADVLHCWTYTWNCRRMSVTQEYSGFQTDGGASVLIAHNLWT